MLTSTRLTALLLTSGDGVVRLCMAMPTVELLQDFGGSQSTAKERRGGWQPPEEAADGDGYGGGRRERRQTPSGRAEHPAKPGLTSPAWGQHGEGGSAPAASSRCRIASPFAVAALGWAKFGPPPLGSLAADRLVKGFGCNLLSLYRTWEPQGGF